MATARRAALLAASAVACHAAMAPTPLDVGTLPGVDPAAQPRMLSGYIPVRAELVDCPSYLYFSLALSANDYTTDPLMVWLNGGPGSSSMLGMFWENGPIIIDDAGKPYVNADSWHTVGTSFVAIDQPVGVGFSYSECGSTAGNESMAMRQLAGAIDDLLNKVLPDATGEDLWKTKPLHVFGESYGGKYVPEVAEQLLDNHKHVNLLTIGIGDGWVDPPVQQFTYRDYAFNHGLIGLKHLKDLTPYEERCTEALANPTTDAEWKKADQICAQIENYITGISGVNLYDVRRLGNYVYVGLPEFLNNPQTRAALHIPDAAGEWGPSSAQVADILEAQEQIPATATYSKLFTQYPALRVLLYNGVYDMDCNHVGTTRWLSTATFAHNLSYADAPRVKWAGAGGVEHGFYAEIGNATQLVLQGAGHLVPRDIPQHAAAMVKQFLEGGLAGVKTPPQ